jgi:hypothetical protein
MGIQVPFWAPQPMISCRKNAPAIRQLWELRAPKPIIWHESIVYVGASGRSDEMSSAVSAISERCTAYTSSPGLGSRYTGGYGLSVAQNRAPGLSEGSCPPSCSQFEKMFVTHEREHDAGATELKALS